MWDYLSLNWAVHVHIWVPAGGINECGSQCMNVWVSFSAIVEVCHCWLVYFASYLHSVADLVCLHNLHHIGLCLCCLPLGHRLTWVFTQFENERLMGGGGGPLAASDLGCLLYH